MAHEKPGGWGRLLKPPTPASNRVQGLPSLTIKVQHATKEGLAATAIMAVSLKPLQIIGEVSGAQEPGAQIEIITYCFTHVGKKKHSRFSPYT